MAKPLEFSDFSGGITENILQGDPRRYEKGDNFFLTVDHKLEERPGFLPEGGDAYVINGYENLRINGYFSVHEEAELIPQVSRSLFYRNGGVWSEIFGIDNHQALSAGDAYSQTTTAEFQRIVYLATDVNDDEFGALPSKIYKNENNQWVARTVGLPRAWVNGNYTDSSLLAKCITNANALRTSFIAHFQNAKYASYQTPTANEIAIANLHVNIDRYSLCYFQSVTFGADPFIPSPLPTPQAACTDEATLYLLVTALNAAYTHHMQDSMLNAWGTQQGSTLTNPTPKPKYHQDNAPYIYPYTLADAQPQRTKGPGASLSANGTPDTLEEAAAMLDDLWQKWNWHRLAVNVHQYQNDMTVADIYAPIGTKIGDIFTGTQNFPTITPDWSDVIGFANNLKYIYNSHVTNNPVGSTSGGHKMRDNFIYNLGLECRLPDATDLDSAYLLIYWMRSLYQMHYYDATFPSLQYRQIAGTATAGSAQLTSVTTVADGLAVGLGFWTGFFSMQTGGTGGPLQTKVNKYSGTGVNTTAIVSVSASGSLTLDSVQIGSGTYQAQLSNSMYHLNYSSTQTTGDLVGSNALSTEALANAPNALGVDTKSWLLLGQDLFFAFAAHMTNAKSHLYDAVTAWTQKLVTVPVQPFMLAAVSTVSYALFFEDDYVVEPNGIEYLVDGNPIFSASVDIAVSYPVGTTPVNLYPSLFTQAPIVTTRGNTLTNLPVLVNDLNTNYAVSNVTLQLYRTTDGGTTFFKLAELTNGTTSYLDTTNDSVASPGSTALNVNQEIYTTGGVVGHDQPPVCKYVHILNGLTYWGGVIDDGQEFPNRLRQSVANIPDAAPSTFFDDLDSPIVGISSARNNLITFCQSSIYRMAGQFTSTGQGSITHENISDTLGCLNAHGIVRTEIGVFFPGNDGFYYTDGYQIINITLEWKKTYAQYTQTDSQKRSIYGNYDKITRRIWWAMKTGEYDSDNSIVYVFYLNYGVKPSGVFTTISNGLNFRPSSLVFQNGVAHVSHEKGYLFKLDKWNKWDALINPDLSPSQWEHGLIPYHYRSVAVDMGTTFQRKYLTKLHLVGKNIGNQAIQPYALRDLNEYDQGSVPMALVNYTQNCTWGDPNFVWGNDEFVWKTDGKMDVWRRFPAGQLRSDFMQIEFKPAYLPVYASSSYPFSTLATINSAINAITLVSPPGYLIDWPLDVVGYEICFSYDEYETKFIIESVSGTILHVLGVLPATILSFEWQIMGFKKEQRVNISSYVIHYEYLGDENQSYPGANTNSGPGNAGGNPQT